MELVHVRLTAADLAGTGRVVVSHARTGLHQALLVGEELVVTDQDGEFHGATVAAIGGESHDPEYHLEIGARLSAELAAQRMNNTDIEPENAELHDVVDMLGELRDLLRHIDKA